MCKKQKVTIEEIEAFRLLSEAKTGDLVILRPERSKVRNFKCQDTVKPYVETNIKDLRLGQITEIKNGIVKVKVKTGSVKCTHLHTKQITIVRNFSILKSSKSLVIM